MAEKSGPARDTNSSEPGDPRRLRDALRQARIEFADRSDVVVDLRDAEVARLEILSDALDPLFSEIPDNIDLFDRAVSQGDTPRLWIDVVAHVVMGRDKRTYRFVRDTRFGRTVIAESNEVQPIVDAVTSYVARRMIEREHAFMPPEEATLSRPAPQQSRSWLVFALGFVVGIVVLFAIALIAAFNV
jgi:hypothetical protein